MITERFQYTPPWHLYLPWNLKAGKSNDEWLNVSWYIKIPLLGEFIIYPGKVDRSGWYAIGVFGDTAEFVSPCGKYYASVDLDKVPRTCNCMPDCGIPYPMTEEEVLRVGTIREGEIC